MAAKDGGAGKPDKPKTIEIEVNGHKVTMPDKDSTGLEIKQAAIAQGVTIQPNFVLQEELANGSSKVIGDNDTVKLNENSSFTAIAPDDNS
ncbi:multiubiquitin domain-containing protein [Novosphingobium sp. Gsoil 351]|uniref:multiubiquitin domain-containing protein n=1 Tax=Novosphingobium sp. Gsoil 351 TaxID=2675225 RepID=UPI0012B446B1|nr:multiubiquitin domain-containing protein [Novosphingobium sp. Gsoil 351]QGN54078.1 hypothetical protein GKE62_05500 [Novosphingobium sp. Gsoil 351]